MEPGANTARWTGLEYFLVVARVRHPRQKGSPLARHARTWSVRCVRSVSLVTMALQMNTIAVCCVTLYANAG